MKNNYFIASHVIMALLTAYTFLLIDYMLEHEAQPKLMAISYLNIIFICFLLQNHVKFLRSD